MINKTSDNYHLALYSEQLEEILSILPKRNGYAPLEILGGRFWEAAETGKLYDYVTFSVRVQWKDDIAVMPYIVILDDSYIGFTVAPDHPITNNENSNYRFETDKTIVLWVD